jgi:microcystin-dependent protein
MSEAYVGEIRLFGFPRTPNGWFQCDGSLKSIAEYEVLYTLIGTTYGGNGVNNFAVPDLRGRVPLNAGRARSGTTYVMGQSAGSENVTLLSTQMPAHTHTVFASTQAGSQAAPGATLAPAAITTDTLYLSNVAGMSPLMLSPTAVQPAGGTLPHDNMAPTLAMSFCICWAGVFPSQG